MIQPHASEIARARAIPDGWVYRIAGNFPPEAAVPPEAIVGAWQVDAAGEIAGEFVANATYDAARFPLS